MPPQSVVILSGLVAGTGLVIAAMGVAREVNGLRRPVEDPDKVIQIVSGLRQAIIGLAILGIGLAWLLGQAWLLVLSLVVVGEETLETSVVLWALRRERRMLARSSADRSDASGTSPDRNS